MGWDKTALWLAKVEKACDSTNNWLVSHVQLSWTFSQIQEFSGLFWIYHINQYIRTERFPSSYFLHIFYSSFTLRLVRALSIYSTYRAYLSFSIWCCYGFRSIMTSLLESRTHHQCVHILFRKAQESEVHDQDPLAGDYMSRHPFYIRKKKHGLVAYIALHKCVTWETSPPLVTVGYGT